MAQARQGRQHKLDASSFVKECLSEPQSGRVSMKQFIVQLAAGCPPTEGSPFAFSGNDNSCFGWRELKGLPLILLGATMGDMSRILIYIPKCQEVASGVCGSNCLVIPTCSLELDFFFFPPWSLSSALRQNACPKRRNYTAWCTKSVLGCLQWVRFRRRLDVRGASHLCLVRLPLGVCG